MSTLKQETKEERGKKLKARVLSMISMALVMLTFVLLYGGLHPSDNLRVAIALISILGFILLNIPTVFQINRTFNAYSAFLLFLRLSFAIPLYYYIFTHSLETAG